jgi:hypothetical protein
MNNLEPTVPRAGSNILDTPGELGPPLDQPDPAMPRDLGVGYTPHTPHPTAAPPVTSSNGYDFVDYAVDNHWEVSMAPPGITVHDHSSSNPSTWSCEEWKAALKRDPEKYTRLYQELATKEGGLSEDVTTHKAEMGTVVATALQDFNRDMTLLKSILDANHETQKALAQFRV